MSSASSDDDEAPQVVHFAQGVKEEKERRKLGIKPVAAVKKKKSTNDKLLKKGSKKARKEVEIDLEAANKYKFDDEQEEQVLQERLNQFERLERKSNFIDINPVLPPEREVKLGKKLSAAILTKIPIITKAPGASLREDSMKRHDARRRPLQL